MSMNFKVAEDMTRMQISLALLWPLGHGNNFKLKHYSCKQCKHWFQNQSGITQHTHAKHPCFSPPPVPCIPDEQPGNWDRFSPVIGDPWAEVPIREEMDNPMNSSSGDSDSLKDSDGHILAVFPCDSSGNLLPSRTQAEPCQMLASHINTLLDLWAMYQTINNLELGDVKWQSFAIKYTGDQGVDPAQWMNDSYDVWFQDPHEVICNIYTSTCHWQDFMSGNWAWYQVDMIAQDPDCLGFTFVPIVLGSDKTTVSVATRQNNYYPLYLSIRNVHNSVHCTHHNGIVLIGFLAMPKATREHAGKASFWNFWQQLFRPPLVNTQDPEVTAFGDGHYQHVIYGFGPYIVDYEEQALLACIVHNWCPCEHFQVYLPAIEGHFPWEVVSTFHAFLEFCYTVQWNVLTAKDLDYLDEVLTCFHHHCKIFKTAGVLFGTLNGLCSLITELKHVKAIKKPYWCTSKYCALGQMLIINKWLDKLAVSCTDFKSWGMLEGTCLSAVVEMFTQEQLTEGNHQVDEDNSQQEPSTSIDDGQGDCEDVDGPRIEAHIQLAQTQHEARTMTVLISIYNSASLTFYAPSNLSGVGGMCCEYIQAMPAWRQEGPQYDCVFIITDPDLEGMCGMDIAHVLCFFFKFQGKWYPCAVVWWFDHIRDMPDETTGMWMVCPSFTCGQQPNFAIIHLRISATEDQAIPLL
ncbi:hypothetical protein V8B97DRAFT_2026121 [Scleroderma yunnanense]